jgi:hypothetical protein
VPGGYKIGELDISAGPSMRAFVGSTSRFTLASGGAQFVSNTGALLAFAPEPTPLVLYAMVLAGAACLRRYQCQARSIARA